MNKYCVVVLILFSLSSIAQINDDGLFRQKLESISENLSLEDADFTVLEEQLQYYKENPLAINQATRENLHQLFLLNDIQINSLLTHIEQNGPLLNIYELQAVDGFDAQTINNLLPYIQLSDNILASENDASGIKNTLLFRSQRVLENQKGYTTTSGTRYLGSPDKLFMRYRFNVNNKIMAGITAEKDAGEQLFNGTQKQGFDYYSAHVIVKDVARLKTLVVGDYQFQFGQGLVAWSGFGFSKTSDAIDFKKTGVGIRAHTSLDENLFLRGAAATVGLGKLSLTGFVSAKKIDANTIDTLTNGEVFAVSSLQTTGQHATLSELLDRKNIQQTIIGGNLSFKTNKMDIGLTAMYTKLSAELKRDVKLYNQFYFRGSDLLNVGLHYSKMIRNFNFFGETAVSDNGATAYLNGLLLALDRRLSVSILNRNYQRNYQTLIGNAFSENSTPQNERGTYAGIQLKPLSTLSINTYMDVFSFPWSKYQVTGSSHGVEYFSQLNYSPNKKVEIYARFRIKEKPEDLNYATDISVPAYVKQRNYRINYAYKPNTVLRLSTRVEWVTRQREGFLAEKGFLIYQDVQLSSEKYPVTLTLRYALFETDSYNTRIYAYESEVPFAYSIPAYYYKGSRTYIMLRYRITKKIDLWLRYAQTFYDNQQKISAGTLNEINGNTKSEVKAELRYVF